MGYDDMTSVEIHALLRGRLLNEAGEGHYRRIGLAARLLKDKAWVRSPEGGGGDEDKALDRLEADCFADLCGLVTLPQILDLYHHMPDVEVWRKAKFNLRRLWADWRATQRPEPRPKAAATRRPPPELTPPNQFPELTPSRQRKEYDKAVRMVETDAERIRRLEAENASLRQECVRLKAEVARLRKGMSELTRPA